MSGELRGVLAHEVLAAVQEDAELREKLRALLIPEPASSTSSPWLNYDQAADYLGVSRRTLERMVAGGRVRSATIGSRVLLHRDDLDAAAAREDVTPATPPRRRARTLDGCREEA